MINFSHNNNEFNRRFNSVQFNNGKVKYKSFGARTSRPNFEAGDTNVGVNVLSG